MKKFKYLFEALYNDNTTTIQTQEDKSALTEDKNAFYDVLQRMGELKAFALYNEETGAEYLLDFKTLQFKVNGVPFYLHDLSENLTNIRLIYFRTNVIDIISNVVQGQRINSYSFGFQALNAKNENCKYIMTLT